MQRSFLRIILETLGWFMVGLGAFYIFSEHTLLIHYFIFIIGVIMILFYFPYMDGKKKKQVDKGVL